MSTQLRRLAALSGARVRPAEELEASRHASLATHHGDLWIFGYGSLMWNPPAIHDRSVPARVANWSRSFCLEMPHGRGTPQAPGLMLALVSGGECTGIAYRIPSSDVTTQTQALWIREMAFVGYQPGWVGATRLDPAGAEPRDRPLTCLTFTADQTSSTYRGDLSLAEQARRIASASGVLGTNRDYLERTSATLRSHHHTDQYLEYLEHQITAGSPHGVDPGTSPAQDHLRATGSPIRRPAGSRRYPASGAMLRTAGTEEDSKQGT